MAYALLAIGAVALMLVLNAYWPVRREPMATPSFFAGWLCGELPLQNLVVAAIVAIVFGALGALGTWPGWVGLALLVAATAGLVGLAVLGVRATAVTMAALAATTKGTIEIPVPVSPAQWGSWWRLSRAVPLAGRSVSVVRNIDYAGDGLAAHRLDIYAPRGGVAQGAPVMVYIHGGAWVIGDKREQGKPMMFELVARGWVCVTVNYRLSPKATWPEHVIDCKRALAWVNEHIAEYGGGDFVAVSGGSAGGHLAALLALTPGEATWQPGFETADTAVDACLPFYGVYEMTGDPAGMGRHGSGLLDLLEAKVMKASIAEHRGLFEQASPTCRVNAGAPPFFVAHGTNDTLVPVQVARTFVEALRAVTQAPVTYVELPRAQHAFDVLASLRSRATTAGAVLFLDSVRADRESAGVEGRSAFPERRS